MKRIVILISLAAFYISNAQPNCYIYPEGSGERKACELSQKSSEYQQGSREKQELFDSIIAIGPNYAWAYYQKSVPYLKRGFLSEGLQILNKAIELDPIEYLCYRAYWYWQYKNYRLCIIDLERYYQLPKAYQQFTPGGDKDMRIILGLAYAKEGHFDRGIEIISNYLNNIESEDYLGFSDYHTLGMLYTLNKQYNKAILAFEKQFRINSDISDSYYFLGLAYKGLLNTSESKIQLKKAQFKFSDNNRFRIINPGFSVYASDVEKALQAM